MPGNVKSSSRRTSLALSPTDPGRRSSGGEAQGRVDAWPRFQRSATSIPTFVITRTPRRIVRELEGRGRETARRRNPRESHLPSPVSDARLARLVVRRRRREGFERDVWSSTQACIRCAARRRWCSACSPSSSCDLRSSSAVRLNGSDAVATTRRSCRRRSADPCACSSRARTKCVGRKLRLPFIVDQRPASTPAAHHRVGYETWSATVGTPRQ